MSTAISVHGVSKRFRLTHEQYPSLKERVIHLGRVPSEEFWALRDIDLTVGQGQTYGLLGHNGSGKSTLLKCVAGILQPTTGEIRTHGRLAALLELGAGFHPELTGRENVYLNGSILGLSRREIDRLFDDIVGFAELEQFIDMQVRNYSSGMFVRLGFAIAVNVDPEVLLVDEVLAVGDEAFQAKCIDRVQELQADGRTIVVVTHAPDLVRRLCHGAAVLEHGQMIFSGGAGEAVRSFREHLLGAPEPPAEAAPDGPDGDGGVERVDGRVVVAPEATSVRITSVDVVHPGSSERPYALPGEPVTIRVGYRASTRVDDVEFTITLYDDSGAVLYAIDSTVAGTSLGPIEGDGEVLLVCDRVPFLDGTYPFSIGIRGPGVVYDWQEQQHRLEVMNPGPALGRVDLRFRFEPGHGAESHPATPARVPQSPALEKGGGPDDG